MTSCSACRYISINSTNKFVKSTIIGLTVLSALNASSHSSFIIPLLLIKCYENNIILIFENFLKLESDIKKIIGQIKSKGIIKEECDEALSALRTVNPMIVDFTNLLVELMEIYLHAEHEVIISEFEEKTGRRSKSYRIRNAA